MPEVAARIKSQSRRVTAVVVLALAMSAVATLIAQISAFPSVQEAKLTASLVSRK